jgi:hypothetical protein
MIDTIIGCGKVAHLHAKAIGALPNATLAAVWSRFEINRITAGINFGLPTIQYFALTTNTILCEKVWTFPTLSIPATCM